MLQIQPQMVSTCCEAPPVDEIDEYNTGRCSNCKENAIFGTQCEECGQIGRHYQTCSFWV